jgi:hypothetical protein
MDVFLFGAAMNVTIDIKPGEFPNPINLRSHGNVPVAILSSSTFDATQVDPLTVELAGAAVRLRGQGTPMTTFTDVNYDGYVDLLVHVRTEALELSEGDPQAVLNGRTTSGTPIRGVDSVKIVP